MAKSAIGIVFDDVNKEKYATFKKVEDLRAAVNEHVKRIESSDLSKAWKRKLIRLLDLLRDRSKEFPGLSFMKQRTIAKHFGLKKPDTAGEWLKKLAALGIVKIVPTKRKGSMHQTVNFVQILPVAEKRGQENAKNGEHETKPSLNTKSLLNTYSSEVVQKLKTPYEIFKETAQSMIGDKDNKRINRMYGVYLAKLKRSAIGETKALAVALHALKAVAQASKHRNIENLAGFFSNTMRNMIARLTTEYTRVEYVPEWVNEEYVPSEPSAEADERRRRLQERIAKRKKC